MTENTREKPGNARKSPETGRCRRHTNCPSISVKILKAWRKYPEIPGKKPEKSPKMPEKVKKVFLLSVVDDNHPTF